MLNGRIGRDPVRHRRLRVTTPLRDLPLNLCLIDRQIGNDIADLGRLLLAPGGEFAVPVEVSRVVRGVRIDDLL